MTGLAPSNGRCQLHGGCSDGPLTAEGSHGAPPLRRSTVGEMRRLGQQRRNEERRGPFAELRRVLAMIQKGNDAGIDPEGFLIC